MVQANCRSAGASAASGTVQVTVCTPLCQAGMPASPSALGTESSSAVPMWKLWSKPAVLSTWNSMVSPGWTTISGTTLPSGSVNLSAAVASSWMTRGLSGVPPATGGGVAVAVPVLVLVPLLPAVVPPGLVQQSGTGVSSGPGV